jgi:hypothetical protein
MAADCCMHLFREDREVGPPGVYSEDELLAVVTEAIETHPTLKYKRYLTDWVTDRIHYFKKALERLPFR